MGLWWEGIANSSSKAGATFFARPSVHKSTQSLHSSRPLFCESIQPIATNMASAKPFTMKASLASFSRRSVRSLRTFRCAAFGTRLQASAMISEDKLAAFVSGAVEDDLSTVPGIGEASSEGNFGFWHRTFCSALAGPAYKAAIEGAGVQTVHVRFPPIPAAVVAAVLRC